MLKEKRKALKIKATDAAKKLKCSPASIHAIERGLMHSGAIFGKYLLLLNFTPPEITRLATGLPNQTDIEELLHNHD